ncbi:site-specific integrase [Nonomuraea sp. NPDC046570]|uniref:site-specific integrase n=1 Tax=Nonomuraea sp. NPDC046570 TaxID=3155255 RepID=UPI0033D10D97
MSRNPAKIKGADNEHTAARPILTIAQVFELADRMGRNPAGNIRALKAGGYQLRFRRGEGTHPHPGIFATRADAERALWTLADHGQADSTHDRRFRALVLLATFASLRWGEVTALRSADLDLKARTVRVREQLLELGGRRMVLGPVKSRAGRRTVSIPSAIIPALVEHLRDFIGQGDDAFVFLGKRGGFLQGGNFRREARWSEALAAMGLQGFHFHDLRHTGNTLAAQSGTSLADLKARMGHDSDRAALIYQHATRAADQKIADALDARVAEERGDDEDGAAGVLVPAG